MAQELDCQVRLHGKSFIRNLRAVRQGSLATVHDWCGQSTLLDLLAEGEMSINEWCSLIMQLLDMLMVLKERRIVHADIKVSMTGGLIIMSRELGCGRRGGDFLLFVGFGADHTRSYSYLYLSALHPPEHGALSLVDFGFSQHIPANVLSSITRPPSATLPGVRGTRAFLPPLNQLTTSGDCMLITHTSDMYTASIVIIMLMVKQCPLDQGMVGVQVR